MAVSTFLCLGCGADIKNSKGNRLLSTKLTQHVIPVWKRLIEEEINRRGTETETATESLNRVLYPKEATTDLHAC